MLLDATALDTFSKEHNLSQRQREVLEATLILDSITQGVTG